MKWKLPASWILPTKTTRHARADAILSEYGERDFFERPQPAHFIRLWKEFVAPHRGRLLLALGLVLLGSVEPYIWSGLARIVIDDVLAGGQPIPVADRPSHLQLVLKIAVAFGALHIAVVLISWLSGYLITVVGQKVVYFMRKRLHERMHTLPLSYFDNVQTGKLLSIMLSDVGAIQGSVGGTLVNFCKQVFLLVVGLVIAFTLNYKLALLILVAMPLYVMNYRHFQPRIRLASTAARKITAELYTHVEERLSAVRTLKIFRRERVETLRFAEHAANLARVIMHSIRFNSWLGFIGTTINVTAVGLALYMGFGEVRDGTMTFGEVMQFYYISAMLFQPPVEISRILAESQHVGVILARVFNLMDSEPEPADRPQALRLARSNGDVAFELVSLTYPGARTAVLNNISFRIPAGATVAILGPSGVGKSTLLHLMMRFYDPTEGRITLDSHDLRDIRLNSVRSNITMVLQEPVIFSGTLAENIRYGCLDAADGDVVEAARGAELHDFVMSLPDRYDTLIGERGTTLSGGERQRLALARSLLTNPSVLLLDDTTSALDAATEGRVRRTLETLMRNRTCFVVTHRVATAMEADLVMILKDGKIQQFGAPEDLGRVDGYFRDMIIAQNQTPPEDIKPMPV